MDQRCCGVAAHATGAAGYWPLWCLSSGPDSYPRICLVGCGLSRAPFFRYSEYQHNYFMLRLGVGDVRQATRDVMKAGISVLQRPAWRAPVPTADRLRADSGSGTVTPISTRTSTAGPAIPVGKTDGHRDHPGQQDRLRGQQWLRYGRLLGLGDADQHPHRHSGPAISVEDYPVAIAIPRRVNRLTYPPRTRPRRIPDRTSRSATRAGET